MARTREFDPDQALDNAMALFWRKGYVATSMDDLDKGTGSPYPGSDRSVPEANSLQPKTKTI